MATPPPSSGGSGPLTRTEQSALIRSVTGGSLYNRQLSSVCQLNGLKSTGVKAVLQRRITDLITQTVDQQDVARFYQIKQSIANVNANPMSKQPSPHKPLSGRSVQTPSLPSGPGYGGHAPSNGYAQSQSYNGHGYDQSQGNGNASSSSAPSSMVGFKPSPFYVIESQVGAVQQCPIMAQHRSSVHVTLRVTDMPFLSKCVEDPSYRVMVFGATEGPGLQDIAFPHQSELKVNGGDFKANLRGLKNKPGSTRPVDITSALRLKASYTNNIEFIYALTHKKYLLVVYMCRVKGPPELVKEISTRRKIPKESVIAELNKKAQDPDVVATSQILSLKCPLSYSRLSVPCRSINCTHIQCFDATSYLQLQEQGPQWLCPICNKSAQFEHLAVDEYVRDILENTPQSLDTVTIEPNGRWSTKSYDSERQQSSRTTAFDDDDDIEVSEITMIGGTRVDAAKASATSLNTPTSLSRSSEAPAPRGLGSTSAKRPAAAVIDLTFSSDEEEDDQPIQRPAKRHNPGPSGFHDYRDPESSLGFLSESPVNYN